MTWNSGSAYDHQGNSCSMTKMNYKEYLLLKNVRGYQQFIQPPCIPWRTFNCGFPSQLSLHPTHHIKLILPRLLHWCCQDIRYLHTVFHATLLSPSIKANPILKYMIHTLNSAAGFLSYLFSSSTCFPAFHKVLTYYEIQENETILYGSDFPVNFWK